MKIDRPTRPKHKNMQLDDHEIAQLLVFDELIAEATEATVNTKTVKKYMKDKDGKDMYENGDRVFFNKEITKIKFKVNEAEKKKFRTAKKNYVKQLEQKYASK